MTKETPLITAEELHAICIEIEGVEDVSPFIDNAHLIVCEDLAAGGFSEDRLRLIELYLAAHLAALTYPVTASESVTKVRETYQYKVGLGLSFTKYGQQALLLSNNMLGGQRIGIKWLGSIPE